MVKKPRHEYRYVRRLGIERLRFAREILPCLLNESRLELALNEAQQPLSKVTYDRPNAAAQEFLRRFHDGVFRAQAAVLVLLAAAAGAGIVASGFHVGPLSACAINARPSQPGTTLARGCHKINELAPACDILARF